MNIGDEVYEEGYSYVPLIVIDLLADSAFVERVKDKSRFWILQSKLRRW